VFKVKARGVGGGGREFITRYKKPQTQQKMQEATF
jgi:hypothetical protein